MKRTLLLFSALMLSCIALWAHDVEIDGIYYNLDTTNKTADVTYRGDHLHSYNGEYRDNVTIPSSITYKAITYRVTYIDGYTFADCSDLISVTIPNSVIGISIYAFSGCSGLTSVTIPESVTMIGLGTFYNCSGLTSVSIPNNVTSIGERAFEGCSGLTSVSIPNNVTSIGERAFKGCSGLTSVTIPNSATSIGGSAFYGCSGLTLVTIGESVTTIADYAFKNCSGLTSVIWNAKNYQNPYTAGFGNQVTSFTFGNEVEHIPAYLCDGMSKLTEITIPNSVTSIGSRAFYDCSGLTSVTIPNSVTSIGGSAFNGTGIYNNESNWDNGVLYIDNCLIEAKSDVVNGSYTIKEGTRVIASAAFNGCSGLTSVTIPNSVTSIGYNAFEGCSGLTSVIWNAKNYQNSYTGFGNQVTSFTFGNEVEHIPASLCAGMNNLKEVTIPNSVTSIGEDAFYGCSGLTSVTIPNSVTSIGGSAFYGCSGLTSVSIGESVTTIADYAFKNCSGLTSVTIPNSVTSIGGSAFYGCSGLTSVIWNAKNCEDFKYDSYYNTSTSPFYNISSNITSFTFGNEVEHIPASLCYGMSKLTEMTIPNSVTSIGSSAFSGCSGLTSVSIGESVKTSDYNAFYNCSGLTKVIWNAKNYRAFYSPFSDIRSSITSFTFGNEVEHIPASLCAGMNNLKEVTIPNSVTSIGEDAFYGCSGLTSVTIPNSVTSIGGSAFDNCSGLTKVNYLGTVDKWVEFDWDYANYNPTYYAKDLYINNELLTDVKITTADSIKYYAFRSCKSIKSVEIGNSVTYIDDYAFSDCSGLTSVIWNAKNYKDFSSSSYAPFYDIRSNITSFTFGNEVEHIPAYLCYGMSKLTEMTIPNSVTSIGEDAFFYCSGLTKVYYLGTVDKWVKIDFETSESNPTFFATDLYLNNELLTDVKITTADSIKQYAFYYCQSIKSVEIGNSVISIGDCAFSGCSRLTSVTIPNSVTYIGTRAFSGCSGLTSVTIPNSVTYIGKCAFAYCYDLTSVTIPNNVKYIDSGAFEDCSGLTSVSIGESVTTIADYAFKNCSELKSVSIGESVNTIGAGAFAGCDNLKKITMYPMNVPNMEGTDIFAHYNAYLYVPCDVFEDYDLDDVFGNFKYIKCIAAEEVDAPDKVEIEVDEDNNANVIWPSTDGAKKYELEISKDGEVFCTLLFNENGQLTSIDFGNRSASVGFQFTVTGLDSASKYAYSMVAMDKKGNELQSYKGTFNTNGYVPGPGEEDDPSAIIENLADANITVSGGMISADKEFSIYNTLGKDVTALNGSLQPGIYVVVLGEDRVKVMVK